MGACDPPDASADGSAEGCDDCDGCDEGAASGRGEVERVDDGRVEVRVDVGADVMEVAEAGLLVDGAFVGELVGAPEGEVIVAVGVGPSDPRLETAAVPSPELQPAIRLAASTPAAIKLLLRTIFMASPRCCPNAVEWIYWC